MGDPELNKWAGSQGANSYLEPHITDDLGLYMYPFSPVIISEAIYWTIKAKIQYFNRYNILNSGKMQYPTPEVLLWGKLSNGSNQKTKGEKYCSERLWVYPYSDSPFKGQCLFPSLSFFSVSPQKYSLPKLPIKANIYLAFPQASFLQGNVYGFIVYISLAAQMILQITQ